MDPIELILLFIGSLLLVLIIIIIVRTISFKPKKQFDEEFEEVKFNQEKPISSLQEMIKCKTISYKDEKEEDYNEFLKFEEKLKQLFPEVHKKCEFTKLSPKSLVYYWRGLKSSKEPIVLMSHYDVVPVNDELWSVDPFLGIVKDGYLWGRGTLDTKGTLNGILSATEELIKSGFTPKNDIYLCFSGNEEVLGYGAIKIVDWFESEAVKPKLVIDEGGAVVENVFPGVKEKCALVGIAEKGVAEIMLTLKASGGHASSPKPHTVIGELAKACVDIENNPLPRNISKPVKLMFDTLGRHSGFLYRMIFSNLWAFGWLLDLINKKQGGELNALMRTTMAFTQMEGSNANNVIPPLAKMGINSRIMTGETSDQAIEYLKGIIKNNKIEILKHRTSEPSTISRIDSPMYENLVDAIKATWGGVIVAPYLMFAASDSRHYGRISSYVYRFSAMELSKKDREGIHGNDEKIKLTTINKIVEFYFRLIKTC